MTLARTTIRVELGAEDAGSVVRHEDRIIASGRGAVCCQAARFLVRAGHDPASRLEVWRRWPRVLCLSGPLGAFARLTVQENDRLGPRFRAWTPSPFSRS